MARLSLYVLMFAATITACQAGAKLIEEAIEQRVALEMHDLKEEIEHMSTAMRQSMRLETAVMSVSKHMNVTPTFASILQELVHPPHRTRSRDRSQHFLGMVAMQSGKAAPGTVFKEEDVKSISHIVEQNVSGATDFVHPGNLQTVIARPVGGDMKGRGNLIVHDAVDRHYTKATEDVLKAMGLMKEDGAADMTPSNNLQVLSADIEHVAGKSKRSISSAAVQSLLFWEIDANNDGRVNATECQAFVHKPRCQQCLAGLFQEQGISNSTELEVKLCVDLGVTSDSAITLTDFMQALQQADSAASLMRTSNQQGESEHDELEGDELDGLSLGWNCG